MPYKNREKRRQTDYNYINTEKGYVNETICSIFTRARKKDRKSRQKWTPDCTRQEIYDELMLYIQDYGKICEYCEQPWTYIRVKNERTIKRKKRGPSVGTNFSIDRLDSTKTYTKDNIVFCCIGCNNRKNQVRLSDLDNIQKVRSRRKPAEPKTRVAQMAMLTHDPIVD